MLPSGLGLQVREGQGPRSSDQLITVGTFVLWYYLWTLLAQQRRLKKFLLFELKESRKELKILLQSSKLKEILND